jgi:small subunit ribosomal protein S1
MTETVELKDFDIFEDHEKSKLKSKEYQDLMALYNSYEMRIPNKGDIVTATYQGISCDQHVLSVKGFKDDIRIDNKPSESKYLKRLLVGESVDVLVSNVDNNNFFIKGSVSELYESRAHQTLKSLEEGYSVEALVKSMNPAGYDIEILHSGVVLPGFMPNTLAGINKLYNPESIIGETLKVMIEIYSEKEGTYIVSRKKYLNTLIPEEAKKLECDKVYTGTVTGTTPFGVFVEFNECLTGMIHRVNLNEDWQNRISEIKAGFQVDFYIKEVIKEKGNRFKIILTQIIRETLWDTIKNGQIIEGKVKEVRNFGALVNLDEETLGLIHNSELEKHSKKVTTGQYLKVKVLSVDRTTRKIYLTL